MGITINRLNQIFKRALLLWGTSCLGLLGPSLAQADGAPGMNTSVSVDIVGALGSAPAAPNRLDVREAELTFFSPADHLFDGQLGLAAHLEKGRSLFEVHEAYVGSTRLIPKVRFRLGQFFPAFGRLNQFHRHDWPFVSAPLLMKNLFQADEGILDTGVELGYLFPTDRYLDLTFGVTNGWVFGHSHSEGKKPLFPTHYVRLATYGDLPHKGGAQVGLNYLGRRANEGILMTFFGLDGVAKWRADKVLLWLLQTEIWYRMDFLTSGKTDHQMGVYVFPQKHLGGDYYLGARWDYFSDLRDALNETELLYTMAVSPTLSYKPSEFSTWRLVYNYQTDFRSGQFINPDHKVEIQALFLLGAHPAHDF